MSGPLDLSSLVLPLSATIDAAAFESAIATQKAKNTREVRIAKGILAVWESIAQIDDEAERREVLQRALDMVPRAHGTKQDGFHPR